MMNEIKNRLQKVAKNYGADELKLFIDELGWEDWMNEYTTAEDGEPITEAECVEIDELLADIFAEAHEEEQKS